MRLKIMTLALAVGLSIFYKEYLSKEGNKAMVCAFTQPVQLDKDTQLTTHSGCTFTASKDWYITTLDDMTILEDPDRELSIALIENTEPTAQEAVEVAWKKFKPNFEYPLEQTNPCVASDGWDEIIQFTYDIPAARNSMAFALARRKNSTWYVQLFDGTKGAFDRRMAQAITVISSFKALGVQEESFTGKVAHKFDVARIQEFAEFIAAARLEYKTPGAAIAIVQDGKIVFEKGFGVRQLGTKELVTPDTLFMIGSMTKSLTTFMMARLVDEGKFEWDTPVTQVMPQFKLGDKTTTQRLLMKHMVSASTGIPRQDMESIFNYCGATPESRMAEMGSVIPTTGFGETFQYSNGMVAAGGYIAAHAGNKNSCLGDAYDLVMQSRVFDPIGMKSTTFAFDQVQRAEHALPHGQNLKQEHFPLLVYDERWVDSIRPAGGAWSNVRDMSRYLITELNDGVNPDGIRVISELNLLKRREPQIKITDKMGYGLGLLIEDDHGVVSIGHGGKTKGFASLMLFLPEHKVGLVILTNARDGGMLAQAVQRRFMELLFDGKPQAQKMVKHDVKYLEDAKRTMLEGLSFTPDSAWVGQFLGTYTNKDLGTITIKLEDNKVIFDAGVWRNIIGQKKEKDGTFVLIFTQSPCLGLKLLPEMHNGAMQLVLEMPQQKYVFTRV